MNSENKSNDEKSKQINSKDNLGNIKSDVILKKVFDIIKQKRLLEMIKDNKKLQNRLKLNISDYKKYCQLYSSIEIELKPAVEYVDDNDYYKFINIHDENKGYIHIYFDNSNEEIKRNYLDFDEKVEKIKIIIDHQVKSLKGLFFRSKRVGSINFKRFYRTNITDMSFMFGHCSLLNELNLSNFHTDNVTNMRYMFLGCSLLKELNFSSFITDNVTNMSYMFSECSALKELNLSNFNFNKVIEAICMFKDCSSLKKLNIANMKSNRMINNYDMFKGCSNELEKKLNS